MDQCIGYRTLTHMFGSFDPLVLACVSDYSNLRNKSSTMHVPMHKVTQTMYDKTITEHPMLCRTDMQELRMRVHACRVQDSLEDQCMCSNYAHVITGA